MSMVVERDLAAERLDERDLLGTGTDKAHVALQDIPELGYLVETGLAQEPASSHQALVVLGGEPRAVFLGVLAHGAELVHGEVPTLMADSWLTEERRAFGGQPDRAADAQSEDDPDRAQNSGDDDVEDPFSGKPWGDLEQGRGNLPTFAEMDQGDTPGVLFVDTRKRS